MLWFDPVYRLTLWLSLQTEVFWISSALLMEVNWNFLSFAFSNPTCTYCTDKLQTDLHCDPQWAVHCGSFSDLCLPSYLAGRHFPGPELWLSLWCDPVCANSFGMQGHLSWTTLAFPHPHLKTFWSINVCDFHALGFAYDISQTWVPCVSCNLQVQSHHYSTWSCKR